jgi:hypothetical protein
MGQDALEVTARTAGFVLVLTGAVLIPAPMRAADAVSEHPSPATEAAPTAG